MDNTITTPIPPIDKLVTLIDTGQIQKPQAIAWKKTLGQQMQEMDRHLSLKNQQLESGCQKVDWEWVNRTKDAKKLKKSQRQLLAKWLRELADKEALDRHQVANGEL